MRGIFRLTAAKVATVKMPGLYADGGGLWLRVKEGSGGPVRSWLFRYAVGRKDRWCGLGPSHTISLAQAREFARQARELRLQGLDPIAVKRSEKSKRQVESAKAMTFKQCAEAYLRDHAGTWRNAQHEHDWAASLRTHAYPVLGSMQVKDIDVTTVLKVLEPLWKRRTVTASRLRGRIEAVLAWATVRGYRTGDNPARWTGHLEEALPAPRKVAPVKHLNSVPYAQIGEFMAKLRAIEGVSARALEFCILCAVRSTEAREARFEEIDFEARVWTIPAERTKTHKPHIVPLSDRAIEVLESVRGIGSGEYLFPGREGGAPINRMALRSLLVEGMGVQATTHGFRATFRVWCAERTAFPREICEAALAHVTGKVEQAYQRSQLVEKRRKLMDAWAAFCTARATAGEVVPIRA